MKEVFREIQGFPKYRISNLGRIISTVRGKDKIMKLGMRTTGYHKIELVGNSGRKTLSVHRLVAVAFIPNPKNHPCINHKDGTKTNNQVDNLEWCTYSHNTNHAFDVGLRVPAKINGNAKLTISQVQEIRKLHGKEKGIELAKRFNVSAETISNIQHRKTWKDLEEPLDLSNNVYY